LPLAHRLETGRLILRKPRLEDAPETYRNYAADPEVTRYLTWTPHDNVDESAAVLATRLAHWEIGSDFTWCLVPLDGSATVIGMISAAPDENDISHWSIGCVLGRPWWNQGFMTEAVGAVLAAVFELPHVAGVWAYVDEENRASMRVLEKAGMRREPGAQHWSVCPTIGPDPRACAVFLAKRGAMPSES